MKTVREATYEVEKYTSIEGEEKSITAYLFVGEEADRAEAIIKSIEGLTIESAQSLLKKINNYILMTRTV